MLSIQSLHSRLVPFDYCWVKSPVLALTGWWHPTVCYSLLIGHWSLLAYCLHFSSWTALILEVNPPRETCCCLELEWLKGGGSTVILSNAFALNSGPLFLILRGKQACLFSHIGTENPEIWYLWIRSIMCDRASVVKHWKGGRNLRTYFYQSGRLISESSTPPLFTIAPAESQEENKCPMQIKYFTLLNPMCYL